MDKVATALSIDIDSSHFLDNQEEVVKMIESFLFKKRGILDESFITVEMIAHPPNILSIFLICKKPSTYDIRKFFEEFIERRIAPGCEVSVISSKVVNFKLPKISLETFVFSRVDVFIDATSDFFDAKENFNKRVKDPLLLELPSPDLLNIMIESSFGLRNRKVLDIQHELTKIFKRFPSWKKPELTAFLRCSLCFMDDRFLTLRDTKSMVQMLLRIHFIEQKLERAFFKNNAIRHTHLQVKPFLLQYQFNSKQILSVFFGMVFFDERETFEESLLERIISQKFPAYSLINGSYFSPPQQYKKRKVIYFELEKLDGELFCQEEIREIRYQLPRELKSNVPSLIPSLKIARNEEEIMKTILHLSNEALTIEDLPQVFISYDQHNEDQMIFRVIIVNIEKEGDKHLIKNRLQKAEGTIKIHWEKEQVIRFMGDGVLKKAYIFQVVIGEALTLLAKKNSSGFLYFARQRVVAFLNRRIGEFRDYNGGMIEQQKGRYESFIKSFQGMSNDYTELIENFFFALSPIEAQVTSSFEELRTLFALLLTICEQILDNDLIYRMSCKNDTLFLVIKTKNSSHSTKLFEKLNLLRKNSVFSLFTIEQVTYLALLLKDGRQQTTDIELLLKRHQKEIDAQQVLRLSFEDLPLSLDPRLGGDYIATLYGKMLFDGLMRLGPAGEPQLAMAQSYETFNEKRRYIFHLRKSYWSNGDLLTAKDFEYAWKTILSSSFQTPFDYFFYPIQNAKLAKEGKIPPSKIGVVARDDATLIVDLEYPFPPFLGLLSHPIYSPINYRIDQLHPNWPDEAGERFICNGPFLLQSRSSEEFVFIKNPMYWDADEVKLQTISLIKADAHFALDLFQGNLIDWLGRPIYPWSPSFNTLDLAQAKQQYYAPTCIHWIVLNTRKFPFHVKEIRQAFAKAIDREKMMRDLSYDGEPAHTLLPKQHTFHQDSTYLSYSPDKAVELFERGLKKLGLTRQSFPTLPLACINSSIRKKTIEQVKEHLSAVLGIEIAIESYDWPFYFKNMCQGNFLMGGISWHTWIDDPSYTLESFTEGGKKTNFSKWEDPFYTSLVKQGFSESDPVKRQKYWKRAEDILIKDVPVIPIYYEQYRYIKKSYLHDTLVVPSQCIVDFKSSKICKNR